MDKDWKDLVGKRVLITSKFFIDISEAIVVAVSPSGKYLCLDFSPQGGSKHVWREADDIVLLEVLGEEKS